MGLETLDGSQSTGIIAGLIALALPIVAVIAFIFIVLKLIEVIPFFLNWLNRPKLRSEYEERRKTAMQSCPKQLSNKDLIIDFEDSSLLRANIGIILGYSTIPANSIIMPDDNKLAKLMPTNFRILYYVPHADSMIYSISMGLMSNLITDIVFTDENTKTVTNTSIVLKGNSIEPMIGGAYHLLVSNKTPVYNIDNSMKMRQVSALNSEFARTMKDCAENALRLNPAHTASLEHEGGTAEIPVGSPMPSPSSSQNKGLLP